jgi:hypothetical protein
LCSGRRVDRGAKSFHDEAALSDPASAVSIEQSTTNRAEASHVAGVSSVSATTRRSGSDRVNS